MCLLFTMVAATNVPGLLLLRYVSCLLCGHGLLGACSGVVFAFLACLSFSVLV
jgi:hypothetical protein